LLKGGTTEQGVTAAVSHTAALATPQTLLRDAAQQAGVVLVDTFEQFVRATTAAAKASYLPENLMVVTNAGGPSVVLMDEASHAAIPMAKLSSQTVQALRDAFPSFHIANPLDLLGDATAEDFDKALHILSTDLHIHAIACLVTEQAVTNMSKLTQVLAKPRGKKPLFVSLIGGAQLASYRKTLAEHGVITSEYPNEVVETMAALQQARRNMGKTLEWSSKKFSQTQLLPKTFEQLQRALEQVGLRFPTQKILQKKEELRQLAELQFPLVGKTTSLTVKHKAKVGAVATNLASLKEAEQVFKQLIKWSGEVVYQETIVEGVQALVGLRNDPQFGWYLAVGLGGSLSDALEDRAYVFLPASPTTFARALKRTKLSTVLNIEQTEQCLKALLALQMLVLSTKNLQELEINPLFISNSSCVVADMKCS
jgi:acetyltransferase